MEVSKQDIDTFIFALPRTKSNMMMKDWRIYVTFNAYPHITQK